MLKLFGLTTQRTLDNAVSSQRHWKTKAEENSRLYAVTLAEVDELKSHLKRLGFYVDNQGKLRRSKKKS